MSRRTLPAPAPIAATDAWHAVMDAAGHRCHCTGACGSGHTRTEGRCDRTHGGYAGGTTTHLVAAPTDPAQLALPAHRAALLPAPALSAWCPTCHDQARRRATAQSTPEQEPDALF